MVSKEKQEMEIRERKSLEQSERCSITKEKKRNNFGRTLGREINVNAPDYRWNGLQTPPPASSKTRLHVCTRLSSFVNARYPPFLRRQYRPTCIPLTSHTRQLVTTLRCRNITSTLLKMSFLILLSVQKRQHLILLSI